MGNNTTNNPYLEMEPSQWGETKQQWIRGVKKFHYFEQDDDGTLKKVKIKRATLEYLVDVYTEVGNGGRGNKGKFLRGEYQFSAQRTAARLGLGGNEESQKKMIQRARKQAKDLGFIEEIKKGTGGGGYANHGCRVRMIFDFEQQHGLVVEGVPKKPGGEKNTKEKEPNKPPQDTHNKPPQEALNKPPLNITASTEGNTDYGDRGSQSSYIPRKETSWEEMMRPREQWDSSQFGQPDPNPFDGLGQAG